MGDFPRINFLNPWIEREELDPVYLTIPKVDLLTKVSPIEQWRAEKRFEKANVIQGEA